MSICISGKERVCLALCIAGQFRDHFEGVFPTLNGTLLHAAEFGTDVYVDTWAEPGAGDMHRPLSNLKEMTPAYDAPCHKSYKCDAVSCPSNLTKEERANAKAIDTWNKEHPRDQQIVDPGWADHYGSQLVWLNAENEPASVSNTWPVACDPKVYDSDSAACEMPPWLAAQYRAWYRSTIPNSWKMYGCHAAIAQQEKCRGREYDVIIKMRPDSKFWGSSQALGEYLAWAARKVLQLKEQNGNWEGVVQTDSILPLATQFSDKYATGSSKAMHYYLNSWSQLQNMMRKGLIGERAMGGYMRASPYPYTGRCTPASCGPAFQRANWHAPESGLDLNTSIAEAVAAQAADEEREESDASLRDGSARQKREGRGKPF
jgi:hypothetical protein